MGPGWRKSWHEKFDTPYKWEIVYALVPEEDLDLDADTLPGLNDRYIILETRWGNNEKEVKPDLQYFWLWTDPPSQFRDKAKATIEEALKIEGDDLVNTMTTFLFV